MADAGAVIHLDPILGGNDPLCFGREIAHVSLGEDRREIDLDVRPVTPADRDLQVGRHEMEAALFANRGDAVT